MGRKEGRKEGWEGGRKGGMKRIEKKITALVHVNPRYFTEVINHVLWKKDRGELIFLRHWKGPQNGE